VAGGRRGGGLGGGMGRVIDWSIQSLTWWWMWCGEDLSVLIWIALSVRQCMNMVDLVVFTGYCIAW